MFPLNSDLLENHPEKFLEILKKERPDYMIRRSARIYNKYTRNRSSNINFPNVEILGSEYILRQASYDDPINCQSQKNQYNWYSPLITCLIMLVGDPVNKHNGNFYGCKKSIPEDLGIEILDLMMERSPDIFDTDYYGDTPYGIVSDYHNYMNVNYRTNNSKFLSRFIYHVFC